MANWPGKKIALSYLSKRFSGNLSIKVLRYFPALGRKKNIFICFPADTVHTADTADTAESAVLTLPTLLTLFTVPTLPTVIERVTWRRRLMVAPTRCHHLVKLINYFLTEKLRPHFDAGWWPTAMVQVLLPLDISGHWAGWNTSYSQCLFYAHVDQHNTMPEKRNH